MQRSSLVALAMTCTALSLGAQSVASRVGTASNATAVRVAASPRIDGRLTEDVWRSAPAAGGFVQREPDEGSPAPEGTEVRFAFDDDALYVGTRLSSRDPTAIRALVTRRDHEGTSEMFCVSMDTYRDRRTAYSFCVTPAGVRLEFYHASDDMDDGDSDWNPVWEASARIDSLGWTSEMRIPFSQLRFTSASAQDWGLNMVRFVPARNEETFWVLVPRTQTGWSSRMGTLAGISGVRPSRRVELLPYVAGDTRAAAEFEAGDPFNKQYTNRARLGGDLKMGLGPNMTLDVTVNPDFGQVEGDPAVVNLSAYETFFDERRPFFLEGADLLSNRNLFYSRRIGAAPPGSAGGDFVERRANTTILGAGKLTGQLRPGLSVAALAALTDRETVRTFDSLGAPQFGNTLVAPRAAWGVASARQLFGKDASTLSATLTGVQRDVAESDALSALLPSAAYSGLIDGRLRWAGGKYDINAFFGFTTVRGDTAAITRLQRSSRRYYQRPDASHVSVDPSLTVLNGTLFNVSHSKMAGAHWLWDIDYQQESPGFEPNDIGRSGAVDNRYVVGRLRWRETRPSRWYRRWDTGVGVERRWNFEGLERPGENFAFVNYMLPNFWDVSMDVTYSPRALDDRLTRGGPVMGTPAAVGWSVELDGRDGARHTWSVDVSHGRDENGSWEQDIGLNFNFQPSDRLALSFDPEWSRGSDARQYIQAEANGRPETFGTRYVFGRVNVSEISAEFRLNYTFTPDLTLETYAQPFVASGRYSGFGELPAARSRALRIYGVPPTSLTANPDGSHTVIVDGETFDIEQQDFNERSLRTNVVLRWEWRAGSTLYLVWQQNREHERPIADARPHHVLEAFGARADNFVALKVSYWLPLR